MNNAQRLKIGIPVLAVTLGLAVYFSGTRTEAPTPATAPVVPETPADPYESTQTTEPTLGKQWDWESVAAQKSAKAQTKQTNNDASAETIDFPFTEEQIYQGLEEIRLKANGDLVIDDLTLKALYNVLGVDSPSLSPEQAELLKEIVQIGLPGHTGEQTAELIGNFQGYLSALDDARDARAITGNPIADQLAILDEKSNLRRVYLGEEVANQLFAKSEITDRHMLSSMEIYTRKDISNEERDALLQANANKFVEDTVKVYGIAAQYEQFENEKSEILSRVTDEAERQKLIDAAFQKLIPKDIQPDLQQIVLPDMSSQPPADS